ncbi:MAG TPA: DUF1289 domain-containing protein [Usitatibacter sp.]|nr:DUF1289 domain-containing protein [Usitatibacter sp.]
MSEPPVASPCNKVCILDPATQTCTGCFRTIEEIAAWGALGDAERAEIVAALPARRARFEAERGGRGG